MMPIKDQIMTVDIENAFTKQLNMLVLAYKFQCAWQEVLASDWIFTWSNRWQATPSLW